MFKPLALACIVSIVSSPMVLAQGPSPAPAKISEPNSGKMPTSAACIISKAVSCSSDGKCTQTNTIGELKLPLKVTVDFQNQVMMSVAADGFPVASRISTFAAAAGERQLVLQGVDAGIGWVMHGSGVSKTVTIAFADHDTVLSGFGTCEIERAE